MRRIGWSGGTCAALLLAIGCGHGSTTLVAPRAGAVGSAEGRCEAGPPAPDLRIVDAARRQARADVVALIAAKVDLDAAGPDGVTALHWAVRLDDLAIATALVKAGARQSSDLRGISPIYLAALRGDVAMIKMLLDAGSSGDVGTHGGETALMTASHAGNVEATRLFLDRGAGIDWQEIVRGHTSLMMAVEEGHADVVKLLLERKANPDIRSLMVAPLNVACAPLVDSVDIGAHGDGFWRTLAVATPTGAMTAIHLAARDGRLRIVQLLVEAGANVNLASANGSTPLITAIVNNRLEVAMYLLEHGANPHTADNFYKRTPLMAALEVRNPDHWSSLPSLPQDKVDALDVIKALLARKVDTNTRSNTVPVRTFAQASGQWLSFDGQTPFILAALSGDITVMKLLLEHGADPNLKTKHGSTALMAVAGMNWVATQTYVRSDAEYLEAAKLCLARGAHVNDKNSLGMTALHAAANRGFDAMVELLVERGAQLDAKDNFGRTPMKFAEGVFLAVYAPARRPSTMALLAKLAEKPRSVAPASPAKSQGATRIGAKR